MSEAETNGDTENNNTTAEKNPIKRLTLIVLVVEMRLPPDHLSRNYFESSRSRSIDFIKRYIFPGGCLPSVAAMMKSVADKTDLLLVDLQDIGVDYARTLAEWHNRFRGNLGAIRAQGFPEEFLRMWQYYFCYCCRYHHSIY